MGLAPGYRRAPSAMSTTGVGTPTAMPGSQQRVVHGERVPIDFTALERDADTMAERVRKRRAGAHRVRGPEGAAIPCPIPCPTREPPAAGRVRPGVWGRRDASDPARAPGAGSAQAAGRSSAPASRAIRLSSAMASCT